MLPARAAGAASLADVLSSLHAATAGAANPVRLPPVQRGVVVVVDGLGASNLAQRAGHARTLAAAPGKPIASGFPTTTAVALTSLTTGTLPGSHGILGYDALVPGHGVRNQLREWGGSMDPGSWQARPTIFERRPGSFVIAEPKFASSGFTQASLRGATYLGGKRLDERVDAALDALRSTPDALIYLYAPELDRVGHDHGWESPKWTDALEAVDGEVRRLERDAPAGTGMLVTADHGMVDVPQERHQIVPGELLHGVAHVAGEPRCLQLHRDPAVDDAAWEAAVAAWREWASPFAWVATRDELLVAGWLGEVDPAIAPRVADLWVAAKGRAALYTDEHDGARGMVGQHGSLTSEELRVPLKCLGAFR